MNEIAAYDPSTVTRVSLTDIGDVPWDGLDMLDALIDLSPKAFKALGWLRHHLRRYGQLPVGIRALAKIAGVGVASFERMAPILDRHFSRDEDGRWTDHAISRARGGHRGVPMVEAPGSRRLVDPVKSASGKAGSDARWGKRRQQIDLVGNPDRTVEEGVVPSGAMAKTIAPAMANGVVLSSSDGTSPSSAMSGAMAAPSKLASSYPTDFPKEEELASELSRVTREGEGMAGGMADMARSAIVEHGTSPPGQARPETTPPPQRPVDDEASVKAQATPAPSDTAIIEAVVRVCRGKVSQADVHQRLSIYRAWIDEGLDFFEDVLPKIETFARRKERVENCANTHILADARALHASRLATRALQACRQTTVEEPVKVYRDDPALAGRLDTILAALGPNWTRKAFCNNDARGEFALVRACDWNRALAIVDA